MGATVGRRQSRVAKDIDRAPLAHPQSRLRSIVFRDRRESDLSEELQLHLEHETERLQASGLSREEARLQALRLFGGVEQIKEASATRVGLPAGTHSCAMRAMVSVDSCAIGVLPRLRC